MTPEPLNIDISFSSRAWMKNMPDVEDRCHLAAQAAFADVASDGLGGAEVSIVLADDEQVRRLNYDYRGKDKPTNVLSFANLEGEELDAARPAEAGPIMLGDIIIAFGVALSEAEAESKSLADHLSHLVVHGMLHLLGYDHLDDDEAEHMEAQERQTLSRLGISDPYRELPAQGERQEGAEQNRMAAS